MSSTASSGEQFSLRQISITSASIMPAGITTYSHVLHRGTAADAVGFAAALAIMRYTGMRTISDCHCGEAGARPTGTQLTPENGRNDDIEAVAADGTHSALPTAGCRIDPTV